MSNSWSTMKAVISIQDFGTARGLENRDLLTLWHGDWLLRAWNWRKIDSGLISKVTKATLWCFPWPSIPIKALNWDYEMICTSNDWQHLKCVLIWKLCVNLVITRKMSAALRLQWKHGISNCGEMIRHGHAVRFHYLQAFWSWMLKDWAQKDVGSLWTNIWS